MNIRRNQGERVLELGGGNCPLVNPACLGGQDLNVDCRMMYFPDGRQCVDFIADFNKPLPISSEEWDCVFSKFAIEHISWRNIPQFVSEIYRVCKPGGRAIIISPNSEAQMRMILSHPEWEKDDQSMMFGDLDYPENSHKALFNPRSIAKLFTDAGFVVNKVEPFGDKQTDMMMEAMRPANSAPSPAFVPSRSVEVPQFPEEVKNSKKPFVEIVPTAVSPVQLHLNNYTLTTERRAALFDCHYFDCGTKVGGYPNPGYQDFPCHEITTRHVLARSPKTVLELGCGRGYVLKRLQDVGIPAEGLDISKHAWMTRACEGVLPWDVCNTPWPVGQHPDLCYSINFLEHIPEELLPKVFAEMERVSKRGLHGISTMTDGFDRTICALHPVDWWQERLPKGHEVFDKTELEGGMFPSDAIISDGRTKVNVGSYITMYHHNWVNMDVHDLGQFAQANGYRYVRQDLRQGLPFKTGEVDLISCCHTLEHVTYAEGFAFLRECRRAIKPDGGMRIIVPDAAKLIDYYIEEDKDLSVFNEINEGCALSPTDAGKLWSILVAGHQAFYDAETLSEALQEAGWTAKVSAFRKAAFPQCDRIVRETIDIQPEISLIVDAIPSME